MSENKTRRKQGVGLLCLLVLLAGALYVGFSKETLSAGFTGTFQDPEEKGAVNRVCTLTVASEGNAFYLYNIPAELYRKGTYERIDLTHYIIEGKQIERQEIVLEDGRFSMELDGQTLVFEKRSDTAMFGDEDVLLLAE